MGSGLTALVPRTKDCLEPAYVVRILNAIVNLVLHFRLGSTKMKLDSRLENVASGCWQ